MGFSFSSVKLKFFLANSKSSESNEEKKVFQKYNFKNEF